MKQRWLVGVLLAGGVGFTGGVWAEQRAGNLTPSTLANLDKAMHGEAFASAKYRLFAERARKEGHPEVAEAFEKAASTERRQHFAEQADLAGLVKTSAENLRNAIDGETYESETMYPKFAAQAKSAGDAAAAARFTEIAQDERTHRKTFQRILEQLDSGTGGAPKN